MLSDHWPKIINLKNRGTKCGKILPSDILGKDHINSPTGLEILKLDSREKLMTVHCGITGPATF